MCGVWLDWTKLLTIDEFIEVCEIAWIGCMTKGKR